MQLYHSALALRRTCCYLGNDVGGQGQTTPTCEVSTVLLLDLQSRLELLFGMPLSHLVLQVDGVSLLPVRHPEKQAEPPASPSPPPSRATGLPSPGPQVLLW